MTVTVIENAAAAPPSAAAAPPDAGSDPVAAAGPPAGAQGGLGPAATRASTPVDSPAVAALVAGPAVMLSPQGWLIALLSIGALAVVALTLALLGQQRIKSLEQELVRRQQDSQSQAIEAHALAKQAQDTVRAMESKVTLLDGRVAETVLQRSQLEDLIQQLSRSRDENVLADIDAALRVAVQQSAITGSAEPMASALRQAEARLARINQPRVERVRRALARDLDRIQSVAVVDMASLAIKLDEAVRLVDDLPLLAQAERRPATAVAGSVAASRLAQAGSAAASAGTQSAPKTLAQGWSWLIDTWGSVGGRVWAEARNLVRVTRIDNPEAMLVTPEQGWFLRENLKLRLLNARLALLSRQFDTVQADLRDVQANLDRYFDRTARRTVLAADLVRQVAGQARQLNLPRPEESLAALAAAQAGR